MINLDGSQGEGGGALVRTALALAALTRQEFVVENIRAGRVEGGLKAQHLEAINLLKKLCSAKTNEISLGSPHLEFSSGPVKGGFFSIDIGTAGSISLLLQAVVLPSLFAQRSTTFRIVGGTCGKWQMSVDYLQNIVLSYLKPFVQKIEFKILKRGYYPAGGGEVELKITPRFSHENATSFESFWQDLSSQCSPIKLLEQGKLEQIRGIVNVSTQLEEKNVAERIRQAALTHLKKYQVPINIHIEYAKTTSIGGEILLYALFSSKAEDLNVILGSSELVEKGKSSEEIGKLCAQKLVEEISSQGCVDEYLADQLIPYLALLPSSTIRVSKVTNHTLTNIHVAEKFLPVKFNVEDKVISVQRIS